MGHQIDLDHHQEVREPRREMVDLRLRQGRPIRTDREHPGVLSWLLYLYVFLFLSCLSEVADKQHMIRIYRADGNYSIHTFPLLSTTADIISALSGANDAPPGAKRLTTTNKLYLRERGQGKLRCTVIDQS